MNESVQTQTCVGACVAFSLCLSVCVCGCVGVCVCVCVCVHVHLCSQSFLKYSAGCLLVEKEHKQAEMTTLHLKNVHFSGFTGFIPRL
jgi:hypothetical protein